MYHIPNGGKRNAAEAARLKREGVKAGVPDICLPVPRGRYHGLYIELKYGKNKPTEKQKEWLANLALQGNFTAVCYGWEQASKIILDYLNLGGYSNETKVPLLCSEYTGLSLNDIEALHTLKKANLRSLSKRIHAAIEALLVV